MALIPGPSSDLGIDLDWLRPFSGSDHTPQSARVYATQHLTDFVLIEEVVVSEWENVFVFFEKVL